MQDEAAQPIPRRKAVQVILGLAVFAPSGMLLIGDGSPSGKRANVAASEHSRAKRSNARCDCPAGGCACRTACKCICHCNCGCTCSQCSCGTCACPQNCDCNDQQYLAGLTTGIHNSTYNWNDTDSYNSDHASYTSGTATDNGVSVYYPEQYEPYFGEIAVYLDRNNWIAPVAGDSTSGGNSFSYA